MKKSNDGLIEQAYKTAGEQYREFGVDAPAALDCLAHIQLSMHCWQGDDLTGFENRGGIADGGIMATGNYPGKPRNADELRDDIAKAMSCIPGKHRLSLHAVYAETGGAKVERNNLLPQHFDGWIRWAQEHGLKLDFNPTFFSHPKAADGFTLAHRDPGIRQYWIEHGIACRTIGEHIGKSLGDACITNVWIPDGYKDIPADRSRPRELLKNSLDAIFAEPIDHRYNRDAVESKLFGIGTESYVVGSHEFYMGYALANKKLICLDAGHFHPTESIADKFSSLLLFLDELLLHVSRGVRWDSDHVVVLNDELKQIAQEIVRGEYQNRIKIALDYFDASINRIAAWIIGMRAMHKALLLALLEPYAALRECEFSGDFTGRLALGEAAKGMPFGAVWDYYCRSNNVPTDSEWINDIRAYERDELSKRL